MRYRLVFGAEGNQFTVLDERIENDRPLPGEPKPYLYFGYEAGRPMLNVAGTGRRHLKREDIDPRQSILSQRRDPDHYPELTRVAALLGRIVIYRDWSFGPRTPVRGSCPVDVPTDILLEDFSNLPARLAVLQRDRGCKQRLAERLGDFAEGFEDLVVVPEGGRLQLYLQERSGSIPARRLSDGTLRYLCLLAILLDPQPPPIVVIEEPELGLHPDVLPGLADLLVAASERTQLILTTHSTQLVDALTEHPEAVLICEKGPEGTTVRRLSWDDVGEEALDIGLGQLWLSGQIGGTRW